MDLSRVQDGSTGESNSSFERTGVKALGVFSVVAMGIAWASAWTLTFPGGPLDVIWRLKPQARVEFQSVGPGVVVLLGVLGLCCLGTGVGLLRLRPWARRFAIAGLVINGLGDLMKGFTGDRTAGLVGALIAGLLVWFLTSRRVVRLFRNSPGSPKQVAD